MDQMLDLCLPRYSSAGHPDYTKTHASSGVHLLEVPDQEGTLPDIEALSPGRLLDRHDDNSEL